MKNKIIKERIKTYADLDISYESMTLEEIQEKFSTAFKIIKEANPQYDKIKIEIEPDGYGSSLDITWYGERKETAEDKKKQAALLKYLAEGQEKRDRELFEKLKAKFESNV